MISKIRFYRTVMKEIGTILARFINRLKNIRQKLMNIYKTRKNQMRMLIDHIIYSLYK